VATASSGSGGEWSGSSIDTIIDRELGRNHEIRSGFAAYADLLDEYRRTGNRLRLLSRLLDQAAFAYRQAGQADAVLLRFNDGGASFLFDTVRERAVLVWGLSQTTAPNSRDDDYHRGFPRAGDGLDKGHAWSHAQGGKEGGPNYFRQARRLNQAISPNGKLWRAIEGHLASNAGLFAFIRLIYAAGNNGDKPDEVEYGVLSQSGQFRAVIFPNA
jgi:hypothetical protein